MEWGPQDRVRAAKHGTAAPPMRKLWPFSFNLLMFAGYASVGPFYVLFYQSLGFSGTQIGLLTGIGPLITLFFAPLWTRLADRTAKQRIVMSVSLLAGVAGFAAFPALHAFLPILVLGLSLSIFLSPVTSLADSAAMHMLGNRRQMYGRIRLGGTIGYGIAASVAGVLVRRFGLPAAFWACSSLFLFTFLVSQRLSYSPVRDDGSSRDSIKRLLRDPHWILFLVIAFGGGMALASHNYLYAYMKELGAGEATMGFALTLGTIAEVPVLLFGHRLLARFRSYGVLILAMGFTALRLLLFAASQTPNHILMIQALNGLTFPLMWVAGATYASESAPAGMSSTAQGLFGAMVYGFGTAVGSFLGGPLLETCGGRVLYVVFGGIVLVVVAVVTLLRRTLGLARE